MTTWTHAKRIWIALAIVACSGAWAPAQALQIGEGDVVGVFQKNGIEVIVNLGDGSVGSTVDLTGLVDIAAFDGSLAGAKFVALAVPDPGKSETCCGGFELDLDNILYSTLVSNPMPNDIQIETAMGITDVAQPGVNTWFNLLRQLAGTDSEQLSVTQQFSYEAYLGVGTDAIANSFVFSIAGVFDGNGRLEIPLYYAQRGNVDFGGSAPVYRQESIVAIDETDLEFLAAPEAGAALATAAGAAMLAVAGSRRRRRSA